MASQWLINNKKVKDWTIGGKKVKSITFPNGKVFNFGTSFPTLLDTEYDKNETIATNESLLILENVKFTTKEELYAKFGVAKITGMTNFKAIIYIKNTCELKFGSSGGGLRIRFKNSLLTITQGTYGFSVNSPSGTVFTLQAGHKYQFESGKDPVDLGTY